MKKIIVYDGGPVYLLHSEDRFCDLGDDGEFEIHTIEYDAVEEPWCFVARGKWFKPGGEIIKGTLKVCLCHPLHPGREYTAEDFLYIAWEEWQVE